MEMTGSFVLTATGSSMEPFLKGGRDRVTLVPPGARPVRRGDVVLFQRDCGAFVLHRVRA
jgi:phage repressor protein C with HTH and peptisase S24 domain